MRALCAAFPARSPLLPARTRSLRAASVFLTSPPQQDKRARSGTLRLYYTSKQTTGRTNPETHWGNTRNPPRPRKTRPGSRFPPDPHSCLPQKTTVPDDPMTGESASTTVRAASMTGEGADTTDPGAFITGESAHHRPPAPRRTCRTRKPARAREPREPPHSPGFPGSPDPSRAPPARGRTGRAMIDSHTAPTPATTETSTRPAGTPATRRAGQRGNSRTRRRTALPGRRPSRTAHPPASANTERCPQPAPPRTWRKNTPGPEA